MNAYLIAFVGFVYLAVALTEFKNGRPSMGVVFIGYALANAGLMFA